MRVKTTINGLDKIFEIEPGALLADVLRANGFTEVKKGCDTGSCGVCTVLLDGKPVLSCSLLAAKTHQRQITTVKGVEAEAKIFAGYLTAEGADQCGFCAPGFALTVIAMKRELSEFTPEAVRHYLSGNLCRCSGYEGQTRGIMNYLKANNG